MLRICDMRWLVNAFGWIRDVFSTPPFPLKESKPILEDAKVLDGGETAFEIEKSYVGEIHPEEPYLKEPELEEESEGVETNGSPRMIRTLREAAAIEKDGRLGGRLLILEPGWVRAGMIGLVREGVGREDGWAAKGKLVLIGRVGGTVII